MSVAIKEAQEYISVLFEDRYIIESFLGQGGYGSIFKAFDKKLKSNVAIKIYGLEYIQENANELIANRISHPGIIRILDCEKNVLVMDYYKNSKNLKEVLDNTLSFEETLDLMIRISKCIEEIHSEDYCHRDIKPENILVIDQEIKVIDFGLASEITDTTIENTSYLGDYAAPESKIDQIFTTKSEIYSMGVTFRKMLKSKKTPHKKLLAKLSTYIGKHDPQCLLEKLIDSMIHENPDCRPNNISQELKKIKQALQKRTVFSGSFAAIPMTIIFVMVVYLLGSYQFKGYDKNTIISDTNIDIREREKVFIQFIVEGRTQFPSINLERATIKAQQIVEINLKEALFTDADLSGSVLRQSNFHNATFLRTNLERVYAGGANFLGANFTDANLKDAYLKGTLLKGTTFTNANIQNVEFTFAQKLTPKQIASCANAENITGLSAIFLNEVRNLNPKLMEWWDGKPRLAPYSNMEIIDAQYFDTRLEGMDFSRSKLPRANFQRNQFQNANFSHCILHNANFSDSNLSFANFSYADVKDANFTGVILDNADFTGAKNLSEEQIGRAKSCVGVKCP